MGHITLQRGVRLENILSSCVRQLEERDRVEQLERRSRRGAERSPWAEGREELGGDVQGEGLGIYKARSKASVRGALVHHVKTESRQLPASPPPCTPPRTPPQAPTYRHQRARVTRLHNCVVSDT